MKRFHEIISRNFGNVLGFLPMFESSLADPDSMKETKNNAAREIRT